MQCRPSVRIYLFLFLFCFFHLFGSDFGSDVGFDVGSYVSSNVRFIHLVVSPGKLLENKINQNFTRGFVYHFLSLFIHM